MIFAALEQPAMSADYIAAGSFTTARDAEQLARSLSAYGKTALEKSEIDGTTWYSVNLYADGRNSVDAMLEAAWSIGASDAMTIRD